MLETILLDEFTYVAIAYGASAGALFLALFDRATRLWTQHKVDKLQIIEGGEKVDDAMSATSVEGTRKQGSLIIGAFGKTAPGSPNRRERETPG